MAIKKPLAFLLLWGLVMLLYSKAWNCGLIFDFVDWWGIYRTKGWTGFPTGYPDIAIRYFLHFVSLPVFNFFGVNPMPWFLLFTFLHSVAAFVAATVFSIWLNAAEAKNRTLIIIFGVLLFITSPYHTEVVVWKICLLYLIALNSVLLMLFSFTHFAQTGKRIWIAVYYLAFVCSLLTHEISMFFIPVLAIVIVKLRFGFLTNVSTSKGVSIFVMPTLLVVAAYLLLNKTMIGVWLGHYGADVHFNFDVVLLSSTFTKYIFKFIFLSQSWNYEWKHNFYLFLEKPVVAYTSLALYACITLFFLFKKMKPVNTICVVVIASFCFLIAPVLNLYFLDWIPIQGDRLGYVASLFIYFAATCFLISNAGLKSLFVIAPWLFYNCYFLQYTLQDWKDSEDTIANIHSNFVWEKDKKIFLLAIADNFNGAYVYLNLAPSPFAETMVMKSGKDIRGKTTDVLRFNMCRKTDGVDVKIVSAKDVQLTFTGWCSWWWCRDANGYETEDYIVKIENNIANIHFKNKPEGAVYLYQQGDVLKQLENF